MHLDDEELKEKEAGEEWKNGKFGKMLNLHRVGEGGKLFRGIQRKSFQ